MRRIEGYFADYSYYHQTNGNKVCHIVGITLIVISLLGLLDHVVLVDWPTGPDGAETIYRIPFHLSLGLLLFAGANIFYLFLDWRLGLLMTVTTGLYLWIGALMSVPLLWGLFVGGLLFQAIGHVVFEKRAPAFMRNLTHLFIGPVFIQNYLIRFIEIPELEQRHNSREKARQRKAG